MLGFLCPYDENEKQVEKEKVFFVSIKEKTKDDIKVEVSPFALAFARKFNLNKVYLYFEKEKIVFDYEV